METTDSWLTPWHGVAVDVGGRFVLRKRQEAEAPGARLIVRDGRPSRYVYSAAHSATGTATDVLQAIALQAIQ